MHYIQDINTIYFLVADNIDVYQMTIGTHDGFLWYKLH